MKRFPDYVNFSLLRRDFFLPPRSLWMAGEGCTLEAICSLCRGNDISILSLGRVFVPESYFHLFPSGVDMLPGQDNRFDLFESFLMSENWPHLWDNLIYCMTFLLNSRLIFQQSSHLHHIEIVLKTLNWVIVAPNFLLTPKALLNKNNTFSYFTLNNPGSRKGNLFLLFLKNCLAAKPVHA